MPNGWTVLSTHVIKNIKANQNLDVIYYSSRRFSETRQKKYEIMDVPKFRDIIV